MKLKSVAFLYNLPALYPTYDISGPFFEETFSGDRIAYLIYTSKSDQDAQIYQAFEYSVWENHNKKRLRPNQRIEFIAKKFNYSRTNIRSAIVRLLEGETHPMRGYGSYGSLNALLASYVPCSLEDKLNPPQPKQPQYSQPAEPKRAYRRALPEGMEVPERMPCIHCGLPVVLTRNRRYLYIYKNKRKFLHTWCNENFLAKQRAEALNARRERALLRDQGVLIPIKLVHYIAKKPLDYKYASSHGEEYFSEHYEDIGKDYLPSRIVATTDDSILMGASEVAIIDMIKRWLDTRDSMRIHMQGPSFMLFHRIPARGKSVAKEFIHASW